MPSSVKGIGSYSFYGCINLTDAALPSGLGTIGENAFSGCTKINAVDIPASVSGVESNAFSGCKALETVTFHENNGYMPGTNQKFALSIGESAFSGCESLKSLAFPESLTSLGRRAIAGTGITAITIPKRVKSANYALEGSLVEEVIFAEGMTEIPDGVCRPYWSDTPTFITSAVIPDTVAVIGAEAFSNCIKLSDIYFGGSQPQWDKIEKNNANIQESVTIHYSALRIPANQTHYNSDLTYDGSGVGSSNEEQVRYAYSVLAKAIDDYISELNKTVKKEANIATSIQQLRKKDEARKQPVLTKPATASSTIIDAAYGGLANFYDQFMRDHPVLAIGNINLSDDIVTIEAKITREIKRSIKTYNIHTTIGGHSVNGSIFVQGIDANNSAFFGSITVDSVSFPVCSDTDVNANAMVQYIKILADAAEDVTKSGLREYLTEFARVSCITSFTEDSFKELFGKIYDYMYKKGYGKISQYTVGLYHGYRISKDISSLHNSKLTDKLKSADSLYKQIKSLNFTDKSVKDEHIKLALSKVEDARADLEQRLYNYIYHPDEPLDNKRDWIDNFGDLFKKITGKCPVNFTIYDASGNVIGWTEGSYCEFENSIYIEMSGDVETIFIPNDMKVKVSVTSTGEGTMSYSVEQYSGGSAVGRMNYYDVPLIDGGTYIQEIPSGSLSGDLKQLPLTDQKGKKIYGTEYLNAESSCISNVYCWVSEGGTVYGSGEYVRGDLAEMIAYAENGYSFSGWYIDNTLVGTEEVYRFAVKDEIELEAVFKPLPKEQMISGSNSFEKTIGDDAFSLGATTSGDSKLVYYPENEAVAEVSEDGVVTIKSVGTTNILIAANATDNYNAAAKKVILTIKQKGDVKPTPTPTPAVKGFSDVQDPTHAFYKAIYWAADAGITKGYPDGTFGIDRSCTRGEMIMFLWRYAGKPAAKALSKSPFKDVPKTHAFYNAIIWASQKGITKGYPDGTFGINRNVSRGECMMFLWRLRGKPAPKAVSVSPFKDVPKTHAFYNAILWGAQKKITNGYTSGPKKGTFGINENCTRGAIVTFLYRAR